MIFPEVGLVKAFMVSCGRITEQTPIYLNILKRQLLVVPKQGYFIYFGTNVGLSFVKHFFKYKRFKFYLQLSTKVSTLQC